MMNCPKCNKEVSPEWKLCPFCGYEPKKCSNTKHAPRWLPQEAKFCPECGEPLESVMTSPSPSPSPVLKERNVSVGDILCTDNTTVPVSKWPLAGKTAMGVVFYVNNIDSRGWAVELYDSNDAVSWFYNRQSNVAVRFPALLSCIDGNYNTKTIRSGNYSTVTIRTIDYPAAWAVDFENGWYLPAIEQLKKMMENIEIINSSLSVAKGDLVNGSYWSSQDTGVFDEKYALYVDENGKIRSEEKRSSNKVRGVRTFKILPQKPNQQTILSQLEKDGNLLITVNDVTFKMIYVEGGTFKMGATPEQGKSGLGGLFRNDEMPVHQVSLDSFYLLETPVTQAMWMIIENVNPSETQGMDLPMENVIYSDCMDYIEQLNDLTGFRFRLPTEAEWEYAARGGKFHSLYRYSGSNVISEVAWCRENSDGRLHPVKEKRPNAVGLYDMSGNVAEYCNDYYDKKYYKKSPANNPQGPSEAPADVLSWTPLHILRGGGFGGKTRCGVSYRSKSETYYRNTGFRLALSPI